MEQNQKVLVKNEQERGTLFLTTLITKLQQIQKLHGNLPVYIFNTTKEYPLKEVDIDVEEPVINLPKRVVL